MNMLSMVPDVWGPKLHSPAGSVTRTRTGPNAISFTAPSHFAIVMLSPQPRRILGLNSDSRKKFSATAGTLELVPAQSELFAGWETPKENFLFALSPERVQQLAMAEFDNDTIDLELLQPGHVDHTALRLAKMLESEFRRARHNAVNELYVDSLITVFATHLLRSYSKIGQQGVPRRQGGFPPKIMSRVTDYINAHIADKISLANLAEVAGFSPSHFTRAFRQSVGQAPHEFVLSLRLREVERLASSTDIPLGNVAKLTGFSSQSHMTATMHHKWLVTPGQIRRDSLRK
ncbi:helix-turn-helix domain-containing protein [Brucella anthropi]|uniref:helix-turn-helix domain-containing protein n=2 Tax=Brucella anthropi TaxID=529 RepID=UPI00124C783D|nr:AraC family transcriptional regulator [Brucella anthropi]KAB2726487.1 helix-turn-helix domain-containing protein [Brucella anthropi]KAB2743649.1 helix-turn-helix domain-containing protein [Brucella anthropi]KAB2804396.1 helix-turn-helix domain-containing protein [Brucella anthropi]